jgi:hypothetical protein
MAGPTFDEIFVNKVDSKVESEITRRKNIYSKGIQGSVLSDDEYKWLYRKTAYLTLRRLKSTESVVIYDINLGKPLMDIVYNENPADISRFREVSPQVARDVNINSAEVTQTTGYPVLLGPVTVPLLDLYTPEKGFIATTLIEASIDTIGEGLAYTTKFSVKFIIHDRDQVSFYLENLMRPLTPIELGFGWSTEDNDPNRGFVRGTVTNFSFSANSDGSWNCMIEGYSNPSLVDGVGLTSVTVTENVTTVTGRRNDTLPIYSDNTYVKTTSQAEINSQLASANLININGGLGTILTNLIDNTSAIFDNPVGSQRKISIKTVASDFEPTNIKNVTGYYIIDMPTGVFLYPLGIRSLGVFVTEAQTLPRAYIRLDSLIHIINCILAYNLRTQKDTPTQFIINPDVSYFSKCDEVIMKTGPADFYKFAFPYSSVGDGYVSFPPIVDFKNYSTDSYYLGAILLNVEYVLTEFLATISNIKNNSEIKLNTFQGFLNNLFKQLDVETGGMIQATCFMTDTEVIIKNINSVNTTIKKEEALEITAFTTNSVCREILVESDVSNEIITVAALAGQSETSIGNSVSKQIITENGKVITIQEWKSYSEAQKNLIRARIPINIDEVLVQSYLEIPSNIINLIEKYNISYRGIAGDPRADAPPNQTRNQDSQYLDEYLQEPYPTSHYAYVMRIQELYKLIFQGARQSVFEGNNTMWKSIFNLRTATFPIKLKIKLDGIHGFKQGNSITTNWLPTGYNSKNCYFTILRISHTISNNDWYTELEAIYRIILP